MAQLVKTFAEKSDFMSFYKQNKFFYQSVKDIIRTNYAFGSNIISFFNENFEQKINRFNVYFSPIYGGWQHGPKIKIGDYIESFYFGGIVFNNKTEFYYPDLSLYFTLITEFDHTPINAITNEHFSELEKLNSKLPILYDTEKVAYGNIHETINEYLTWGFALQYFYEKTPQEYEKLHKRIVNWMEQRKFVRFEEFMNFYEKKYINNRKNYPMFEDFFSSVINWIQDI